MLFSGAGGEGVSKLGKLSNSKPGTGSKVVIKKVAEVFTRNELIFFKVAGWAIAIIVPLVLYRWNSRELKESEKKQGKRIDDLWKKLQEEVVAKKDLEKEQIKKSRERMRNSLLSRKGKLRRVS